MLSAREAQESLHEGIRPLPAIRVPCLEALGAVLAEDAYADIDNPAFDNSAVDGFALIASDTVGHPLPRNLRLLEDIPAGSVPKLHVNPGTCSKIMTGAPMPPGADAVVMVEDTESAGSEVRIWQTVAIGEHVRHAGEDVRAGEKVLSAGALIQSPEISILAAMGCSKVLVHRRTKVAVITTGDEIVEIDRKPGPGQIRNSNAFALAAMVAESGAQLHSMQAVGDTAEEIETALTACLGADIIVTSGGVSVGEKDFVKPAVEKLGTLSFWRVNMKPGKPIAFGRVSEALFFGLPGNPISTMVTFELFVKPAIRKLSGHPDPMAPRISVTLQEDITRTPGREEYVRAIVFATDNGFAARTTGAQGSSMLRSMVGANALLILPAESHTVMRGDTLKALLLRMPTAPAESA